MIRFQSNLKISLNISNIGWWLNLERNSGPKVIEVNEFWNYMNENSGKFTLELYTKKIQWENKQNKHNPDIENFIDFFFKTI